METEEHTVPIDYLPFSGKLKMTTPKPQGSAGDLCTFNVQHGFAEALLRGMRSSFLADSDYHHLTQCENLDDVRLNMTETDYSEAISDMNTLTPNSLQKAAIEKVCSIFRRFCRSTFEGKGLLESRLSRVIN